MKRGKRLLLVAHCVLNQNSVVYPLARAPGALAQVVETAVKAGVGLIQLPCPEMVFGGLSRAPGTRAEYDTAAYRILCRRLAKQVEEEIRPLLEDGCQVVGVLGIAGSPSCAVDEPRGVWMRELLQLPQLRGVPQVGVPEGRREEFGKRFQAMISPERLPMRSPAV